MKNSIRVCLIGTGRAGMIHGRNLASCIENGEIVAVCDPIETNLRTAQSELRCQWRYSDYREVMKNPEIDAVFIVTPTVYHKEIAISAAKAKKHIFCEKPLAMNEQECIEIIQAAKENNVQLQVGFMRRFEPSFLEAKKMIDEGLIGDIVLIKSLTHGPSKPKPWMYDIRKSNGVIGEVNSHDLDTLRWLSGSEISSVYAIGGNYRSQEMAKKFPDYLDTVAMNLTFKDGKIGQIDGAQYVRYGYDARTEILGTKGSILIGEQSKHKLTIATENQQVIKPSMHSWTYLFKDAYRAEVQAFVDAILSKTEVKCTGYDGLQAVKLVDAALQSYLENRIISVE
ncbi:MAG: Gfo/Idh/MocA family oxidoreductase [Enterococcus sp.]